jgi:hypothetical protein
MFDSFGVIGCSARDVQRIAYRLNGGVQVPGEFNPDFRRMVRGTNGSERNRAAADDSTEQDIQSVSCYSDIQGIPSTQRRC